MATEQPASTPSVFVRRSVVPAAVSQTTAKYWEDLDPEGSYNHVNLSCQGILMPERDLEFKRKLNKDQQSLWRHPTQELSYKYFRKQIDMMLMSIEGRLFVLEKERGVFVCTNSGYTIETVSGRSK